MQEDELIKKSQAGDEKAFAELFSLNRNKIFRHALSILKDEEYAEDVTQESFLKAFLHIKEFRSQASFGTWLYRIAHNLALNRIKKKKEPRLERDVAAAHVEDSPQTRELQKQIDEAIKRLSPKHREVFILYECQKYSQKEIAALLKVPPGTIRSRLYYARRHIRAILRRQDFS